MKHINPKRFVLSILFFSVILSFLFAYSDVSKANISDNILRLHIIASGNSEYDQALKLKVRNRILKEANDLFYKAATPENAILTAEAKSEFFKRVAIDELRKNGCPDDAAIEIGQFDFPSKKYGKLTLPAGKYNAVRVIIGEGKGKNWWCVMFPPLCFTNGTLSISEECDDYLRSHLSNGEYHLITDCTEKPELRFKTIELIKALRN